MNFLRPVIESFVAKEENVDKRYFCPFTTMFS